MEPLVPGPAPAPVVGSLTYLTGFNQLAALTREDDPLHERVLALESRGNIGAGVFLGSVVLGTLLFVGALTVFKQTNCTTPSVPPGFSLPVSPICDSGPNDLLLGAGLLTMVIGGSTGIALAPSEIEWYGVINEWNTRHPERTLLVAPHHH